MHNLDDDKSKFSAHACEGCGCERMTFADRQQTFQYGDGQDASLLTVTVPVWSCPECGLEYTDEAAEAIRHEAVCQHLGRLSPREIVAIRKSHGYTQEQFANITSIGIASLKRWETANQIQNASMDKLIRLLSKRENLEMVMGGAIGQQFSPVFRTRISDSKKKEAGDFRLRLDMNEGV